MESVIHSCVSLQLFLGNAQSCHNSAEEVDDDALAILLHGLDLARVFFTETTPSRSRPHAILNDSGIAQLMN